MVVKLNHSVLTVCKIAIKTFSINEKKCTKSDIDSVGNP